LRNSLQGEHSCRWLKKDEGGVESAELFKTTAMSIGKKSITMVSFHKYQENVGGKRPGSVDQGGAAQKKKEASSLNVSKL
jgi:hypothetical protein